MEENIRMSSMRSQYQRVVEIGEGGFGTVFSAFDIKRGRSVALKEPVIGRGNSALLRLAALKNEYKKLQALTHPNIVQALDFHDCEDGTALLVMELCSIGSVASVMKSVSRRFHEAVIRRYLREALLGLEYLHDQGVIHRDIKPDNLLLTSEGVLKLADFGLSRDVAGTVSDPVIKGTIAYVAPEIIKDCRYSEKSDIWALGLSMISLSSNTVDFWGPVTSKGVWPLMFHIGSLTEAPQPPSHLSPTLLAILKSMLDINPSARPSARDILMNPYFLVSEDDIDGMEKMEQYLSSDSADDTFPSASLRSAFEVTAPSTAAASSLTVVISNSGMDPSQFEPQSETAGHAITSQPSYHFFFVLGRELKPYTVEQNKLLNDALGAGKVTVRIKIPREVDGQVTEYEIDFKKMTQKNGATNSQRAIVKKTFGNPSRQWR